jgi:nickel/cobalt transporter (NiCoT) family protein
MQEAGVIPRKVTLRRFWRWLDPGQRRTMLMMTSVIVALHVIGFGVLIAFVSPRSYSLGSSGVFTIGLGVTAWTLGLRHAFDADHISAIDNTTRKLMNEGTRPVSVGFWFSLGHSSIVFLFSFLLAIGLRALAGPVANGRSGLHDMAGWIGTLVSGTFLYGIAALNVVILIGIIRIFREMRTGHFDERALEERLSARGFFNRFFGGLTRMITKPTQMYPVGVLFGLGFDTATEVALLVVAGTAGVAGLPWYSILILPVLFAAGMSLCDTIDGSFMTYAYAWAFARPVRKVFYNIAITSLSVAVALIIGTVELSGLIFQKLNLSGGFWTWWENININLVGFIIVGLFLATWAIALSWWRLGHVEERWSRHLADGR